MDGSENPETTNKQDFYYLPMPEFCVSNRLKNGEGGAGRSSCATLDFANFYRRQVRGVCFSGWGQNSSDPL